MFRPLRNAPPALASRPRAQNFFVDKTAPSSDSDASRRARVRQAAVPEDRAASVAVWAVWWRGAGRDVSRRSQAGGHSSPDSVMGFFSKWVASVYLHPSTVGTQHFARCVGGTRAVVSERLAGCQEGTGRTWLDVGTRARLRRGLHSALPGTELTPKVPSPPVVAAGFGLLPSEGPRPGGWLRGGCVFSLLPALLGSGS